MDISIVSLFNYILDLKSHTNWKTHLTKVTTHKQNDKEHSSFLYQYDNDEFTIENISFEYSM